MLSQAEIDALLGAVADGSMPADEQPSSLNADGRLVKTYDFRRPAKFSNEQLRTLQAIHENVGASPPRASPHSCEARWSSSSPEPTSSFSTTT